MIKSITQISSIIKAIAIMIVPGIAIAVPINIVVDNKPMMKKGISIII